MKLKTYYLVFIAQAFSAQLVQAEINDSHKGNKNGVLQIVVPKADKSAPEHDSYYPKLIALALEKTKRTDGEYSVSFAVDNTSHFRKISEISSDNAPITIMWASTSPELESGLLPIRISILKGLNSYRVFLIRKEDQEKFHKVRNLSDLKSFVAGQGAQWADTEILTRNGLQVASVVNAENLFDMLVSKRFDYFPRGLYEVWEEQRVHAKQGLIIEDSLLLHYSCPVYLFVNKNAKSAADRIERGLRIAMIDGSFDELFRSIYGVNQGLEEVKNKRRKIIELRPLVTGTD